MRASNLFSKVSLTGTRPRLAGVFLALCLLLALWCGLLILFGGLRFEIYGLVVSSRNPVRPAFATFFFAVLAWALDRNRVETTVQNAIDVLSRIASRVLVPLTAILLLFIAATFGAHVASGADESGYVSQSVLWLEGKLRIEHPFADGLPWPDADATLSPLGYRPLSGTFVPTYSPGLPILMAGARFLSGCAPFFIVPVCTTLLVLFTWLLGRRIFGSAPAIAAAVMLAASPVVVTLMLAPISDVPVAAFWMGALLFADLATLPSAALAGGFAGMAVLIRPNLAPLALFPLVLTVVHGGSRGAILARACLLSLTVAPFAVFIVLLHTSLYGSPLSSGYGDLSTIYSMRNFSANIRAYPLWWWQTHGLIGWLFVLAVFRPRARATRWRVITLVAFAMSVGLSYAFYLSFEHWGFLRFVLSAVPVALLLSADAVQWLTSRFGTRMAVVALSTVTAISVGRAISLVRSENVFGSAAGEQRYADAGVYVNATADPKSVVLAMQHSGSVRYYSGRVILRYDLLDPAWLDRALEALTARGYSTYALLESWEEVLFRERFAGQQTTRLLDAGPAAVARNAAGEVRVFILHTRGGRPGRPPEVMPTTGRRECPPPSPAFAVPR